MKKITAILLILLMLAAALTSCAASKDGEESEMTADTALSTVQKDESVRPEKSGVLPKKLTATKVGSIAAGYAVFEKCGIIYRDDSSGKLGTMSLDGKTDGGAKWTACKAEGEDCLYFSVTTSTVTKYKSISDMNHYGIANAAGELLIPEKYASFDILNERYVKVYEVTEKADGKDENAIVYMSVSANEGVSGLFPDEDDVFLKGNWKVFDLYKGKTVDGIGGTKAKRVQAYGDFIEYYDDEGNLCYAGPDGKEWTNTWFIDNERGIYITADEAEKEATVYSNDGKKLFCYDMERFDIYGSEELYGEYFKVCEYKDGEPVYYLMDAEGSIVSAGFADISAVMGEFVVADNVGICDFEGNVVYETGDYIVESYEDPMYGALYYFETNGKSVILDAKGDVVFEEEDIFDFYPFAMVKNSEEEKDVYSFKDKDFTIGGSALGAYLAEVESESGSNVVDVISGKAIIKGYESYEIVGPAYGSGKYNFYVYAEKPDGGFDIFEIK